MVSLSRKEWKNPHPAALSSFHVLAFGHFSSLPVFSNRRTTCPTVSISLFFFFISHFSLCVPWLLSKSGRPWCFQMLRPLSVVDLVGFHLWHLFPASECHFITGVSLTSKLWPSVVCVRNKHFNRSQSLHRRNCVFSYCKSHQLFKCRQWPTEEAGNAVPRRKTCSYQIVLLLSFKVACLTMLMVNELKQMNFQRTDNGRDFFVIRSSKECCSIRKWPLHHCASLKMHSLCTQAVFACTYFSHADMDLSVDFWVMLGRKPFCQLSLLRWNHVDNVNLRRPALLQNHKSVMVTN